MHQRKDDGVSDVIAFIMILFLIVGAVAMWMLVVIPSEGNAAENSHNEKVLLEFAEMKQSIDQLWLNNLNGYSNSHMISLAPTERTSLSTLMYLSPTLGSGILKIEKGTKLEFYDTERHYSTMTDSWSVSKSLRTGHNDETDEDEYEPYSANLLRIRFTTDNSYAPNYTIMYEGGTVWFADAAGAVTQLLDPAAYADDPMKSIVLITYDAPPEDSTKLLLGNMPVSVKYKYYEKYSPASIRIPGVYNSGVIDERVFKNKSTGGDERKYVTREYIELWEDPVITKAYAGDESAHSELENKMDEKLQAYWATEIFDPDILAYGNPESQPDGVDHTPGKTKGTQIVLLSYDILSAKGVGY